LLKVLIIGPFDDIPFDEIRHAFDPRGGHMEVQYPSDNPLSSAMQWEVEGDEGFLIQTFMAFETKT
jgi:hypothetical protein